MVLGQESNILSGENHSMTSLIQNHIEWLAYSDHRRLFFSLYEVASNDV